MTRGRWTKRAGAFVLATAAVTVALATGQGKTGCFSVPSSCGYPDRTNTGITYAGLTPGDLAVVPGASLPSGVTWDAGSEVLRIETNNVTLTGLDIHGAVAVDGNNVTIRNSRVFLQSGCGGAPAPLDTTPCGSYGIRLGSVENRISGTKLQNVDIIAQDLNPADDDPQDPDTRDVKVEFAVRNNGDLIAQADHLYCFGPGNCWTGTGTIRNSYFFSHLVMRGDHTEPYINGGNGDPTVLDHNTILNPASQTSAISIFDDFGPIGPVVIRNNLLAGGGYIMYLGNKNDPNNVFGPVNVTGNRIARSLTNGSTGHDSHGYWPNGGTFGVFSAVKGSVTKTCNNFWDDDHSDLNDSPGNLPC